MGAISSGPEAGPAKPEELLADSSEDRRESVFTTRSTEQNSQRLQDRSGTGQS